MSKGTMMVSEEKYNKSKCDKCGMHSIAGFRAINIEEPLWSSRITYKHDKYNLSAYDNDVEFYHIHKNYCQTKEQQIDWVNQIAGKKWGDSYKFTKALKEACQDWGTW
tara:strand:- start:5694 stop:6017 length:324 start_codon:yes stop_codon:yes gene_type:complete